MKTLKKIIFGVVMLLLTVSCKKDDLPKATQEGKNIMAAKVSGKVWKAAACWSCIGGGGLSATYEQSYINLAGEQKNDNSNIYILLYFEAPSVGTYTIDGTYGSDNKFIRLFNGDRKYETSQDNKGEVVVTKIDRVKKIVSGTFSFKAENKDNPNDIITVTDGRFDVTYN